jgi:hypothetical protein
LCAAEVALRGLNRHMANKKLNLLQFASSRPTQASALYDTSHVARSYRCRSARRPRFHPETLPVLLRSRATLPYRAVRKHLGAVGE